MLGWALMNNYLNLFDEKEKKKEKKKKRRWKRMKTNQGLDSGNSAASTNHHQAHPIMAWTGIPDTNCLVITL